MKKLLERKGCFWKCLENSELFTFNDENSEYFESLESGEIFDKFSKISDDLVEIE